MQLKRVGDQVVVLMGASSGIGRETALRFARKGAKVVVSARGEEGLDSLVEEIRREDGEAIAVPADTSEFDRVKAVADRAVQEYGRLDTWVHLAAVGLFATFEETTPEEFGRIIDVNLMGQVYGAMAALPHIKREGGGALIHVSSMGAKRSIPLQSAYCASKHGIDGFLESLRVELQHEKLPISVTQVMPATINTPLFDKAHQAGRQAGRSTTDLPASHRLRSHPPCRREPSSGSGRRGRGQGGDPQSAALAAVVGCPTQGQGF
ncbi:MAG TPA: SDR family oxidoreductase [Rubrobacter sp.]|nr:SDR family oxidoreductase [Rubrobacter sp.]